MSINVNGDKRFHIRTVIESVFWKQKLFFSFFSLEVFMIQEIKRTEEVWTNWRFISCLMMHVHIAHILFTTKCKIITGLHNSATKWLFKAS